MTRHAADTGDDRGWRPLRPLLPAAQQTFAPDARLAEAASTTPGQRTVAAACDACRKHKTKCSGDRPVCDRCRRLHTPCCYASQKGETSVQALKRGYGQLHSQASAHEELFRLLQNLPAVEAHHVLERIRSGDGISDILAHIRAGSVLVKMGVERESPSTSRSP